MATTVWPGERCPTGTPWSVWLGLAVEGRLALEVYDAEALIDVVVATPVAPEILRGARRSVYGRPSVMAWGRLPPDSTASRVLFTQGRWGRGGHVTDVMTISVGHRRAAVIRRQGVMTTPIADPHGWSRWLGRALIAGGLAMIPWLVMLAIRLPPSARAAHWPMAWVGLDILEALGLVTTGVLIRRGNRRSSLAAAATATSLLVDAWFDVTTAATGPDLATAILIAALLELPIATLCAVLSIRTFPKGNPDR
jgi:hypothetical protein